MYKEFEFRTVQFSEFLIVLVNSTILEMPENEISQMKKFQTFGKIHDF